MSCVLNEVCAFLIRVRENVMNRLSMPFFISREYHIRVSYRLWLTNVSLLSHYSCTIRSKNDITIIFDRYCHTISGTDHFFCPSSHFH